MFDYAKKIKEYRERKCLTQEELAINLASVLSVFTPLSVCEFLNLWTSKELSCMNSIPDRSR